MAHTIRVPSTRVGASQGSYWCNNTQLFYQPFLGAVSFRLDQIDWYTLLSCQTEMIGKHMKAILTLLPRTEPHSLHIIKYGHAPHTRTSHTDWYWDHNAIRMEWYEHTTYEIDLRRETDKIDACLFYEYSSRSNTDCWKINMRVCSLICYPYMFSPSPSVLLAWTNEQNCDCLQCHIWQVYAHVGKCMHIDWLINTSYYYMHKIWLWFKAIFWALHVTHFVFRCAYVTLKNTLYAFNIQTRNINPKIQRSGQRNATAQREAQRRYNSGGQTSLATLGSPPYNEPALGSLLYTVPTVESSPSNEPTLACLTN